MSLVIGTVNKGLTSVYDDVTLVGFVRKGLDNKWYPELPPSVSHERATRDLIRAYRALQGEAA